MKPSTIDIKRGTKKLWIACTLICFFSCQKSISKTENKEVAPAQTETTTTDDQYMLCAEQSQNRISIIDITTGTFFWNWEAGVNNNIPAADAGWFDMTAEAKRVYNGLYILTTASNAGVAL